MKRSYFLLCRIALCGLPLAALVPGCGGGGGGSDSPGPTPTATPTLTPASPVNFNLTLTKSAGAAYDFTGVITGSGSTQVDGEQFIISTSTTSAADSLVHSTFRITLPRQLEAGDVIAVGTVYASRGFPFAGVGSWNGAKGRIVVESRTSSFATLRLTNVVLNAGPGGDLYRAKGTLTFNGTVAVKVP